MFNQEAIESGPGFCHFLLSSLNGTARSGNQRGNVERTNGSEINAHPDLLHNLPESQSIRMAHPESLQLARHHAPARSGLTSSSGACVQSQITDGHKDMSVLGIKGNPVPRTTVSITAELLGCHRPLNQPGRAQDIRNRSRTVQSSAGPAVAPAVLVGRILNRISRSNCPMHCR